MDLLSSKNPAFLTEDYSKSNPYGIVSIDYPNNIERITNYIDFNKNITLISRQMIKMGIRKSDCVAVISKGRIEVAEIFFAAMRVGAIPLTINPDQSIEFIEGIISETRSKCIYYEASSNKNNNLRIKNSLLISIGHLNNNIKTYEECLKESYRHKDTQIYEGLPSYITYTSGSTGKPKGVKRIFSPKEWLELYSPFLGINFDQPESIKGPNTNIISRPIFHSVPDVIHSICSESETIIMYEFDPIEFLKLLSQYKLTSCDILPSSLAECSQKKSFIKTLDLSNLRLICTFGAPVENSLINECESLFDCKVVSLFAMSEGNPILDFNGLKQNEIPTGSVGLETNHSGIKLISSSSHESDFGEMWFKNPTLFESYYNKPKLTESKFDDGWFMTGDIFFRDSAGFFYYRGRKDDMFICDGENAYPLEIETVLCMHKAVMHACVLPVDSFDRGQVPVALISCNPGMSISVSDLKAHYLNNGAKFLCPILFKFTNTIPIFGPGKINKKQVREVFFGDF